MKEDHSIDYSCKHLIPNRTMDVIEIKVLHYETPGPALKKLRSGIPERSHRQAAPGVTEV